MAFTYTGDLSIDRDFVRFHVSDTVQDQSFLSDAEIASLVSVAGSKEKAVIQAIQYIIGRLSTPNFRADWLQVDNKSAREGYEGLLKLKRAELGIPRFSASVTHVYRADSAATEEPDYTDGRP